MPRWRRAPVGPLGAIAMGGNRGDTLAHFALALAALRAAGLAPLAISSAYRTAAATLQSVGVAPAYFNAVVLVRPWLPLAWTWRHLRAAERRSGARCGQRWAGRALDLDILAWGTARCSAPLQVPHPRLGQRPFVLWPLCELAADWQLPAFEQTPAALMRALGRPRQGLMAVKRDWWPQARLPA